METEGNDYFLCNEGTWDNWYDVIGDTPLEVAADVTLPNINVTSLALTSIDGKVLACVGAADGSISQVKL